MDAIRVIVKIEQGAPVLFLPEAPANPGCILCYAHVGQHSEASMSYYYGLRNPTDKHTAKVAGLLSEYANLGEVCKVERIKRDSAAMRSARWGQA